MGYYNSKKVALFIILLLQITPLFSLELGVFKKVNLSKEGLYAAIDTTEGTIYLELYPQKASQNVGFFTNLSLGLISWYNEDGGEESTPYYKGRKLLRIASSGIVGGQLNRYYTWIGYDIIDEIYELDKEIKGTIWDNEMAAWVWSTYILPYMSMDYGEYNSQIKDIYNQVEKERNYKPLYGQKVEAIQNLVGSSQKIYRKKRKKDPKKGDIVMVNIGPDTASGVFMILTQDKVRKKYEESTVIGSIIHGHDILDKITQSISSGNEVLIREIYIKKNR